MKASMRAFEHTNAWLVVLRSCGSSQNASEHTMLSRTSPSKSLCASHWRTLCTNEGSSFELEPGVERRTRYYCAKAKSKCSACTQCCLRSRGPPKAHQFPWCQQHSAGNTTVSIRQPRVPLLLAALDSQVSLSCQFRLRQAANVRTIVHNCPPRLQLWNIPFHFVTCFTASCVSFKCSQRSCTIMRAHAFLSSLASTRM
jgi:hypothetical protein